MKKYLFYLIVGAWLGYVNVVQAQTEMEEEQASIQVETNEVNKVAKKKVHLYNFSPKLMAAAQDCLSYQEDFVTTNPDLAKWGELFGGAKFETLIDVLGKEQEKCHFKVKVKIQGISETIYDCLVDDAQRRDIYDAMLDRSTTPITDTITVYMTVEQDGKVIQKIPSEQTMTDSHFNIVWAKLQESCTTSTREPNQEEQQKMSEDFDALPEDFVAALQSCTPKEVQKNVLFLSVGAKILGQKENKCLVKYDEFVFELLPEQLSKLKKISDFEKLMNQQVTFSYSPNYNTQRLLFALDKCLAGENGGGYKSSWKKGNVTTTQFLKTEFENGQCQLTLGYELSINDIKHDYSQVCQLNQEQLKSLLSPYENLLASSRGKMDLKEDGTISFVGDQENEETQQADEDLMAKISASGLCQRMN